MERNLLLGNGINAHLCIPGLNMIDIANRFTDSLIKSNAFFNLMFDVRFSQEICQELFSKTEKQGIESIASTFYDYLTSKFNRICINDRMRILDSIICCAITSIFYDGNKKLGQEYKSKNLPDFSKFSHIFTLNYNEFWDKAEQCVYLHGKYNIDSVKTNDKDVIHYSLERNMGYKGYSELVKNAQNYYNMCELYTRDIIFSPEFYKKSEMMAMGSYPSEHLYPANDLFLHKLKPLYKEIDDIYEIEVFGISPYGDEEIIRKLNSMKKVIVYVYNCKGNEEAQVWDSKLTCFHEFRDSMDIMK